MITINLIIRRKNLMYIPIATRREMYACADKKKQKKTIQAWAALTP